MKLSWKAFLVFLGIFAAGLIAGAALGVRWARRPPSVRPQQRSSIEQFGKNQMSMIAERLELTPEQQEIITPLFDKATEELRQIRNASFKQTNEVFARRDNEVIRHLKPEQVKKFETIARRMRDRLRTPPQEGLPPPPRDNNNTQGARQEPQDRALPPR